MNERETICKTYFLRARKRIIGLRRGFDKQFYAEGLREIWSALDACLNWKFPANTNREMREFYSDKYQKIFENWSMSDMFKESLEILSKLVPVKDMSSVNPRPDVELGDKNDLFEILQLSYRIRSNLDHGAKDLESDSDVGIRNRELVEHSFKVTYEILERTLLHESIISS